MLSMITTFVRNGTDHDFAAAFDAAVAERETTLDRVRSSLDDAGRQRFEEGLGACQHANFSWWQEEHNFYLDLRAHIPLRMAALRIAEIVGAERRDDLIYLFRHELDDMVAGRITYGEIRDTIVARRAYYESSRAQRSEMPAVLGTPPAGTDDPIMKEIFGVDQRLLATVGSVDADTTSLSGVPASSGVARGRARVVVEVTDLGDLEPDEILVCVFTSPNWTPAFAQIAGCVCDTGGALSHTAIAPRVPHPRRVRHRRRDDADPHRRPDRGRRHGRCRHHPRARLTLDADDAVPALRRTIAARCRAGTIHRIEQPPSGALSAGVACFEVVCEAQAESDDRECGIGVAARREDRPTCDEEIRDRVHATVAVHDSAGRISVHSGGPELVVDAGR